MLLMALATIMPRHASGQLKQIVKIEKDTLRM